LEWRQPSRPTLQNLFTNPIYAGAYVYGLRSVDRRRQKPGRPGTGRRPPHLDNAAVVLPDRLPAYITWEQYQRNLAQLQANRAGWVGAPRAGTALLSGVLVCGRCGLRLRGGCKGLRSEGQDAGGREGGEQGTAVHWPPPAFLYSL
jgi:hypothetical protein